MRFQASLLALGVWYCIGVAETAAATDPNNLAGHHMHSRHVDGSGSGLRGMNGTNAIRPAPLSSGNVSVTIEQAEVLMSQVIAQQSAYNAYRVANIRTNTYLSNPSISQLKARDHEKHPQPPALNATVLAAAALIAERDAALQVANGTLKVKPTMAARDSHLYWVSQLSGDGQAPMGSNPSYQVYRDVTKFGAKGDGVTDDTAAINRAIAFDGNCGSGCESSSIKGTLIYFPPGTYLISTPINAYYYSQLVGDANDRPTIKTSASFVGLGAIQTDVYYPNGNGGEWYIEQSNFYRQVRNFIIDITDTKTAHAAGLHWQVAQATSLTYVDIRANTGKTDSNTQMGIFTENGSGGFMSNVIITGGAYGIYGGNQQYTVRDFVIWNQSKACICLLWDWGWTWSGLNLALAPIGISLINPHGTAGTVAGSTYIMDSIFTDLQTGVYAHFNQTGANSSAITFDNIQVNNVATMLEYTGGERVDIPAGDIDFIVVGNIIHDGTLDGSFTYEAPTRPSSLVTSDTIVQNKYFTKSRPQYADINLDQIINVKSYGAYGDGKHDDTKAIQNALDKAAENNLIYFPAGSYLISSTIFLLPWTRMTGEVWSQLVATGSHFADIKSPQAMLEVGTPGVPGTAEISDMLFTSIGPLPGLIMVRWNMQAESPGSAGIWDSHFRLGGAYGTELQVSQCPYEGGLKPQCVAASMMLHITPGASGYFENMWLWVADHDIDNPQNAKIAVSAARGMLVESQGPTWFYGTASEHSMLYQYNFASSTNTFAGMIQTESPYYQGTNTGQSPGPFNASIGLFPSDPVFPDPSCNGTDLACNFAWAVMMQNTTNLTIASAGLYSWFSDYSETCVDGQDCQQRIAYDDGENSQLQLWNLITIGSVEMVSAPGVGIEVPAKPYTQALGHPYWSSIAGYATEIGEIVLSCTVNDTRAFCQEDLSVCDLNYNFTSFAALQEQLGSIPNECVDYIALGTLYNVLEATLNNYTTVDDGYNHAFSYYVQAMKDLIPGKVRAFMAQSTPNNPDGGPGNKFFDCTPNDGVTQRCPMHYTQLDLLQDYSIKYTLINQTGYNAALKAQGIDPEWVFLGDIPLTPPRSAQGNCDRNRLDCINYNKNLDGIPKPKKAANLVIANPKDFVTRAMPNITAFQDRLLAAEINLNLGGWNGSSDDLLQVYSMPVFLVQQAVSGMANAKAIGEHEIKVHRIQLVEEILGGVLAVLPFLNEVLPEIEILETLVTFATGLGNTALTIQGIVSEPSTAPFAILSLLLGGGARDEEAVGAMAEERLALTENDISNYGKEFEAANTEFEATIKEKCVL